MGGDRLRLSRERILAEAGSTGFRPEVFEKVAQLLGLLQSIWSHPFLKNRLALKGGTALNLFVFNLPRLSVDMDLNYIGAPDKKTMLEERPKVDNAMRAVCQREGFMVRQSPTEHAGGKWLLRYESAFGQGANLTVDLNFMFRIPLWAVTPFDSRLLGSFRAEKIPLLDLHEIAAGKLCALLSREAARDLFDAHQLLTQKTLERDRLRLAFIVYGAMNRKDWRTVSEEDISYGAAELANELIPVLRTDALSEVHASETWVARLIQECRRAISIVLPFTKNEREFLDHLLDRGEIYPSLITDDEEMMKKIQNHPGLQWKALNVKEFKNEG
jgi:predicted nucleotidyltransferase component of viral defense system